jgi:hypothetical protein
MAHTYSSCHSLYTDAEKAEESIALYGPEPIMGDEEEDSSMGRLAIGSSSRGLRGWDQARPT